MKKLLLACVGMLSLCAAVPANAADVPVARSPGFVAPRFVAPPVVQPFFPWNGLYVGGHLGGAWLDVDDTNLHDDDRDRAFLYGGQAGYNWHIGQFVLGLEGQISGVDSERNVDWIGTLAGRAGIAFDQILVYGKVGGAWLNGSDNTSGWMAGAGVEYGFTRFWSAKLEYNFLDFGNERFARSGVDHDLTTHLIKIGVNYRFGPF